MTIDKVGTPGFEAAQPPEDPKLREVSRQYEALFLNQLISAMRKTVVKQGIVPESHGERVYQSMLDSEYAQKMSETDQIGLSHLIYQQLLRRP